MSGMLQGCTKLNDLKIENILTTKVKDMSFMFSNCEFLTNIAINRNTYVIYYLYDKAHTYSNRNHVKSNLLPGKNMNVISCSSLIGSSSNVCSLSLLEYVNSSNCRSV